MHPIDLRFGMIFLVIPTRKAYTSNLDVTNSFFQLIKNDLKTVEIFRLITLAWNLAMKKIGLFS